MANTPPGQTPPLADTPRETPPRQTPPLADNRWQVFKKRAIRIPLECILVYSVADLTGMLGLHTLSRLIFFQVHAVFRKKKTKIIGLCPFLNLLLLLLPPANEVWGKVIFSEAYVKNSFHGGLLSQHALQAVSQHALQQVSRGVSQHALQVFRATPKGKFRGIWPGGSPGPHPRGKLRGIWSRPTAKGEIEGDLVKAHTQGGS